MPDKKPQKHTTGTNQPQNGIGPSPKEKPMTDTPDDLPSPDEYLRKMAHVDQEFADARRYLSALCAEDNQGLGALMAEIHRSGRAMNVLAAMAVQALDERIRDLDTAEDLSLLRLKLFLSDHTGVAEVAELLELI
jgi:hypothetical protein